MRDLEPITNWVIAGCPGYAGAKGKKLTNKLNQQCGKGHLRERLSKGLTVRYLVPEPVRQYIEETRCYA